MNNRNRTSMRHAQGKKAFCSLAQKHGIDVVDVSRQGTMARRNITYKIFVEETSDIELPKGKTLTMTFRSDYSMGKTGNVFFEIEHIRQGGRTEEGWFFSCYSNYIVYYNAADNTAIIMDWEKLRYAISVGEVGEIRSVINDGDECITKVCLASIDELKEKNCIVCEIRS